MCLHFGFRSWQGLAQELALRQYLFKLSNNWHSNALIKARVSPIDRGDQTESGPISQSGNCRIPSGAAHCLGSAHPPFGFPTKLESFFRRRLAIYPWQISRVTAFLWAPTGQGLYLKEIGVLPTRFTMCFMSSAKDFSNSSLMVDWINKFWPRLSNIGIKLRSRKTKFSHFGVCSRNFWKLRGCPRIGQYRRGNRYAYIFCNNFVLAWMTQTKLFFHISLKESQWYRRYRYSYFALELFPNAIPTWRLPATATDSASHELDVGWGISRQLFKNSSTGR